MSSGYNDDELSFRLQFIDLVLVLVSLATISIYDCFLVWKIANSNSEINRHQSLLIIFSKEQSFYSLGLLKLTVVKFYLCIRFVINRDRSVSLYKYLILFMVKEII